MTPFPQMKLANSGRSDSVRRRVSNDTSGRKVTSILDDGPPGMHWYPQADRRNSSWTERDPKDSPREPCPRRVWMWGLVVQSLTPFPRVNGARLANSGRSDSVRRRVSNDTFCRKVTSILDDGPPGMHRYPQADQRGSSWTERDPKDSPREPGPRRVWMWGLVVQSLTPFPRVNGANSEWGEFRQVRFCAQARLKRHI